MANYIVLPEDEAEWNCPECSETHDSPESAAGCCISPYEGFKCCNCGSAYSEQAEAANCCPNVQEVYLCRDCNAAHEDESDAWNCCAPDPADLVGGRYKCVIDGLTWPTAEQANRCCRHRKANGEAVESMDDHGADCTCPGCNPGAFARDPMVRAFSMKELPQDDWTKALQ